MFSDTTHASSDPQPNPARLQPLVALRALRRLIQDPQRTEEVFNVLGALAGSSLVRGLRRFRQLPVGQQVLSERRVLLDQLLDQSALDVHPRGSLAAHYLRFVRNGNITADGLVDASAGRECYVNADQKLYSERLRDQHDLWHTLTDYGRDELGEVCLLAFTYAQTRDRGIGVIALVGSCKVSQYYGRRVFGAVFRAYRDGRRAAWLPGQDWEAMLGEPIVTVRERLGLITPVRYQALLAAGELSAA